MAVVSTRPASSADLPRLSTLLAEGGRTTAVPTGVLAQAVAHGLVQVAEAEGTLVGCAAAEAPSPAHVRLSAVVVRAGMRRQGIASRLLEEILERVAHLRPAERPMISAVVGITELEAAHFLLAAGFIGTRLPRSGANTESQIHYQHKIRVEYVDPDARHLVPSAHVEQLAESLAAPDQAVIALVTLAGEPAFEVARFERDDPASLQSGEAAAGIAFSGSLLAAITFILGFALTSSRFPDDVRLLLIGATFSTMLSLIVYASASGELARIRANSFGRTMKWGNVLSEYGGVLPLVISLPVTYAQVSGDPWSTMVLAAALSAAIIGYERSEFSIARRFARTRLDLGLMTLTAVAPSAGAGLVTAGVVTWPWTAALALTLAARVWLCLLRQGPESGIAEHRRQWQIRA